MKIFFAGAGGRKTHEILIKTKQSKLFSYFALVDKHSAFGELDRFYEYINLIKEVENEG